MVNRANEMPIVPSFAKCIIVYYQTTFAIRRYLMNKKNISQNQWISKPVSKNMPTKVVRVAGR